MENRIDQVVTLLDEKKYLILNQAIYQKKNYFLAAGITDDEEKFSGEIIIFEQEFKDGKEYLNIVEDKKVLEILTKYFQPKEERENE